MALNMSGPILKASAGTAWFAAMEKKVLAGDAASQATPGSMLFVWGRRAQSQTRGAEVPAGQHGEPLRVYSVAPPEGAGRRSKGEAPGTQDGAGASSLCCVCGVFVQRFRLTEESSKSQVLDRGGEGGGRPGGRSQRHLQPRATTCLPSSRS